jgi:hypothetical protein
VVKSSPVFLYLVVVGLGDKFGNWVGAGSSGKLHKCFGAGFFEL